MQNFVVMDVIDDFVPIICAYNYVINEKRRRKNKRKCWVHPYISGRFTTGHFYLRHETLCLYPEKFLNYYRMSRPSFEELQSKIEHQLLRRDTNMRNAIPEMLAVTLW